MGLFDYLFGEPKNNPQSNRGKKPSSTYTTAIKLIESESRDDQLLGRKMMIDHTLHTPFSQIDPWVYLWMAKDYETHECFRAASEHYELALKAGLSEAAEPLKRCNNPYNVDPYYNISGSRGCGTPFFNSIRKMKESYQAIFEQARKTLESNPSSTEIEENLKTIQLLATARMCVVPNAKTYLGDLCSGGNNSKEAAKWYKAAAEAGDAEGARKYACALLAGEGVEEDNQAAIEYLNIAAQKGDSVSQYWLGLICLDSGDEEKATLFFQHAAKNGNKEAAKKLLEMDEQNDHNSGTVNSAETSEQDKCIFTVYNEIVEKYNLSTGSKQDYIKEIFQPTDFCEKAYQYCKKQYGVDDKKKLAFEMCMTSFYGCICSVAIWHQDTFRFETEESVWDSLYQLINVEFTDSNAERLLNTKQGEEKAERIFKIISEYMDGVLPIIIANNTVGNTSMKAMKQAYCLGMRVAKKEIETENGEPNLDTSYKENETEKQTTQEKDGDAKTRTVQQFYSECLEAFHKRAQRNGVANNGLIFIPELMPRGEKVVLSFLKDQYFKDICGNDATKYYYLIMSLCIQAGMVMGNTWHESFDELDDREEEIVEYGPADEATELLEEYFDREISADQGNPLFREIYSEWLIQHEPYWKLQDPREYTFRALLAAYQLGISMILEKYGY